LIKEIVVNNEKKLNLNEKDKEGRNQMEKVAYIEQKIQ